MTTYLSSEAVLDSSSRLSSIVDFKVENIHRLTVAPYDDLGSSTAAPVDESFPTSVFGSQQSQIDKDAKEEFYAEFCCAVNESVFEPGYLSRADAYFVEAVSKYGLYAKSWLNELFLERFHQVQMICAILWVLSHAEYRVVKPFGATMAIAGALHENQEVRECALRCFENWEEPETLNILNCLNIPNGWMKDYLDKIIVQLQLGASNAVSGENF